MAAVDYTKRHVEHQRSLRLERDYPGWRRHLSRRDGKLIASSVADIPTEICLKCGDPVHKKHKIYIAAEDWKRGLIAMASPVPLPGFYRSPQKIPITFGLCKRHERERRRRIGLSILFFLFIPFVAFILFMMELEAWSVAVFLLAWPISTLVTLFTSRSISGKPTPLGIELQGVGRPFIELLPQEPRRVGEK